MFSRRAALSDLSAVGESPYFLKSRSARELPPDRHAVSLEVLEQLLRILVSVEFNEIRHQEVADTLVIPGVKPQQVPVMLYCLFTLAGLPEALG